MASSVSRTDRRARLATGALFFTNGAVPANLLPRYPEIKDALGLGNTVYGLTVTTMPVGAIVIGLAAAGLIRRLGAGRVAVAGGLMAAGAIAVGLPLGVHLGISGALFSVVAVICLRFCLPGAGDQIEDEAAAGTDVGAARGPSRMPARTGVMLAALVLVAISGTMVEDAGNSWATLYLATSLGAPHAVAASGFIALVGAQFVGRLLGDRMSDRFGRRAVARLGGLVTAGGMGLALAWPSVAGSIAGFACAGFGVATLVPTAMSQADRLPGLRRGTGLTVVSWLMRVGFVVSPPLVGMVADAVGLRFGLLSIVLAGLLTLLCSPALPGRRPGV